MIVFYIVLAILLFGLLIFVHEFGHFITAKLFGVRVNEFSMFMGPAIWKKQKGETLYALRCIPIGGYCAMEGEDGDSDDPRSFTNAAIWKRFIILIAGAAMNLLAGFVLMLLLVGFAFEIVPTRTVASIQPERPFAGQLQAGDEIYSVNGERVYVQQDITMLLDRNTSGKQELVVIRDGEKVALHDVPMARDYGDADDPRYGFNVEYQDKTVGGVISYSWNSCRDFVRLVRLSLQDLVGGRASMKDLSGPVGIVAVVSEQGSAAESIGDGIANVIYLFALIAVNLAVMNLLPIPALDGGRVVCMLLSYVIEKIIRRKLNPKIEGYLHAGFMILLLALMAFIAVQDVIKLI